GYDAQSKDDWERTGGRYREQYRFRHKIDMDEMTQPKRTYLLTEGLIRRGYKDADVALILGGNFQRVLSEIWTVEESSPRASAHPKGARELPRLLHSPAPHPRRSARGGGAPPPQRRSGLFAGSRSRRHGA